MALPFQFPCLQAIRKRNEATVSERNYRVFKETCEICPSAKNAKEKTTPLRKTQEHAKHAKHAKKKSGTIEVHTNMYVSGRTKMSVHCQPRRIFSHLASVTSPNDSAFRCVEVAKLRYLAHYHSWFCRIRNKKGRTRKRRHKTEDAEGLQTPHMRYLERREMMFTWVAKRNTF